MARAKARKKIAPRKAAKKITKKSTKKVAKKPSKRASAKAAAIVARPAKAAIGKRRVTKAQAAEVRLPLTAPVRVVPAPRPMSPAHRMPMPVSVDRPIAPIQLRQPSLFQRELPPHDETK